MKVIGILSPTYKQWRRSHSPTSWQEDEKHERDFATTTRSGLFTHKGNQQLTVTNNTFWGQSEAGWLSAVWEGARDASTMIYRNNLSSTDGFAPWGIGDGITEDHNGESVSAGTFTNVAGLDFTLPASSPYINAGVLIPGADPVPDGMPDLGAYEAGVPWKAGADPDVGSGHGGIGSGGMAAGSGGNSGSSSCGATGFEILFLPAAILALRPRYRRRIAMCNEASK